MPARSSRAGSTPRSPTSGSSSSRTRSAPALHAAVRCIFEPGKVFLPGLIVFQGRQNVWHLTYIVYRYDRLTAVLSRKSKYGLKALLVLAQQAGEGPVLISELADREAIPK